MTKEHNNTHEFYTAGRVFVIRPFNIKKNRKKQKIDFDRVDKELITPCIESLGLSGGTTGEFVQQGNIREDMFRELLAADIVIADISVHNANVFYELGIRHALRDRCTVLIKADKHTDPGVFDLAGDRYLSYDLDTPSNSIEKLQNLITATLANENKDSPVFSLLPGLTSMEPEKVIIVPRTFNEKVEQNAKNKKALLKLYSEAIGQPWETQGLRLVGKQQFDLAEHEDAIKSWETIRKFNPLDTEANQKLATSYQKIKEYTLSKQAAERALENEGDWDRAETHALIGSNLKTQWRLSWEPEKNLTERQRNALTSPFLEKAYDAYRLGFEQHRSHYFSGLNSTALLFIQLELAQLHPDIWELEYDGENRAKFELKERQNFLSKMTGATELAIESSIRNYDDNWAKISRADLLLLSCNNPEKIKYEYKKCLDIIEGFTAESLANQVGLYKNLGLFSDNASAALEAIV